MRPHRIIGEDYLHRWHLIPRNRWFNIYLHKFLGSDDDRALHDHPWASVSFLLKGKLRELTPYDNRYGVLGSSLAYCVYERSVPRFLPVFRRATHAHRIVLVEGPAWTLFITGPVVRAWGFHCPKGWVHHSDFTDTTGNGIGKGCD